MKAINTSRPDKDLIDILVEYERAILLLKDASEMLHWTCCCTSPEAPKDIDEFLLEIEKK